MARRSNESDAAAARKRRRAEPIKPGRKRTHRALLREARYQALLATEGLPGGNIDPAEALQECLDNAVSLMRYAQQEADKVPEDETFVPSLHGPIPNEWLRFGAEMRKEVLWLAANMMKNGFDERRLQLAEQQGAALAAIIEAAATTVGLTPAQRMALGAAMSEQLQLIQGGGTNEDEVVEGTAVAA